jgi:hypothetical protein
MGIDKFTGSGEPRRETEPKISLSRLDEARRGIEHVTDGLGLTIDDGVREGVAVINALGVVTTQSCEGHLDRGSPSPYIDIRAPGEPTYRFQGEPEQLEAIAKRNDLLPEEMTAWPHEEERARRAEDAYKERAAWIAQQSPEYTPEYITWLNANNRVRATIEKLIAEFYETRPKPAEGHVLLDHDRLRTKSALYDQYLAAALDGNGDALSTTDRERLRSQLPTAQAEMQAFVGFLKDKFFERM